MIWLRLTAVLGVGALSVGGPTPVPRTHVIEIRGMAFHPKVLTIALGDTVVWINQDIVPHTATAAGRHGWDTGTLTQEQRARSVPRRKGAAPYICTLHPTMHGQLIIQ